MADILELHHLKKYYGSFKAVDDISFAIPPGSIFGLLGPNGAGKTTLLRMITGIFYPDEGEIIFDGRKFDPQEDIHDIGYMPEERGLYKKMKVGEQVLYLAQLKGLKENDAREKIRFWFRKFDLTNWWNKKVGDLSKGMQQKVQFISTILHQPRLLILDEPFSGLDPINTNLIKEEIFNLSRQGTTIIFSTHRMEQVEEICDRIVLVNRGKKILDGEVRQIRQSFKRSEFSVELASPPDGKELHPEAFLVEKTEGNKMTVKLKEGGNTNQILAWFLQEGFIIQSFNEILPTINEVFIRQVEKTSGEKLEIVA